MADEKKGFAFNPKMSRRSVLTGGASTVARAGLRGAAEEEAPSKFAVTHTDFTDLDEPDGVEERLGHHKTMESAEAQVHRHARKLGVEAKNHPNYSGSGRHKVWSDTGKPTAHVSDNGPSHMWEITDREDV